MLDRLDQHGSALPSSSPSKLTHHIKTAPNPTRSGAHLAQTTFRTHTLPLVVAIDPPVSISGLK